MASVNKVICPGCGGEFMRTTKQMNACIKRSGKWVCQLCSVKARNAAAALPIGSTRIHRQTGYIEEKTSSGWRRQHILVMERSICRSLYPGEVVHHINECKTDNRLENLQLLLSGEHTALHHAGASRCESSIERIKSGVRSSGRVRLSEEKAAWIRQQVLEKRATQRSVAESLGVSPMTVSRVVNNQTWN